MQSYLDLYRVLHHIYSQLFVDYVARNLLIHRQPDEPINNPIFNAKLDEYLSSQSLLIKQ